MPRKQSMKIVKSDIRGRRGVYSWLRFGKNRERLSYKSLTNLKILWGKQ